MAGILRLFRTDCFSTLPFPMEIDDFKASSTVAIVTAISCTTPWILATINHFSCILLSLLLLLYASFKADQAFLNNHI